MHNVAYWYSLIPHFIKNKYLEVNDKSEYTWVKPTPVYYEEIENIIASVRKRNTESKHKEKVTPFTQEEAIAFLKELGYKIMKPVTEFVEI